MSEKMDLKIQPVYVLSSEYFVTSEYFEPIDIEGLAKNLKQDCVAYVNKFDNSAILDPVVLENQWSSKSAEVKLFVEYVNEQNPRFRSDEFPWALRLGTRFSW
jgi:hypothetical protein